MELAVTKRDKATKVKALREEGVLPAVLYGRSEAATPIAVNRKAFEKVYKAAGESSVVTLTGLGGTKSALIQQVDVHPVSGAPLHADFYTIAKGQKVTVSVPLEFDGTAPAVKDLGGILTKVMHEIEIECEPAELPHAIHVDVSVLATLEDQIKVKDLKFPPSAKEEPVEAPTMDLSAIETSVERGKKEEEPGAEGAAPAAEAPAKEKKE